MVKTKGETAYMELQEVLQNAMMNFMKEHQRQTVTNYKILNQSAKKGQVVFVGSSLMEQFPIAEMQQRLDLDYIIYNRGVSGFVTADLLNHMDECIFDLEPSKLFINIGTNDIGSVDSDYQLERLMTNYDNVLSQIGDRLPNCKVYVMAYYPVNPDADFPGVSPEQKQQLFRTRTNDTIREANDAVHDLAEKHGYEFINVNDGLFDDDGNLKEGFTIEGLHLWANAYSVILGNLSLYL